MKQHSKHISSKLATLWGIFIFLDHLTFIIAVMYFFPFAIWQVSTGLGIGGKLIAGGLFLMGSFSLYLLLNSLNNWRKSNYSFLKTYQTVVEEESQGNGKIMVAIILSILFILFTNGYILFISLVYLW